ncbi:hypothetical protein B0H10DRAFT_1792131, partial [Mycena sp. CBHHK59/15]
FESSGELTDLDRVIKLLWEAITLHPVPHPDCGGLLSSLAEDLWIFQETFDPKDPNSTIKLHRKVLALQTTPDPSQIHSLQKLVWCLRGRYEQLGNMEDLDSAIELGLESLTLLPAPRPGHSAALNILGHSLHSRYTQQHEVADLDNTIEFLGEANKLLCEAVALHPGRDDLQSYIALILQQRFENSSNTADIDSAIKLH